MPRILATAFAVVAATALLAQSYAFEAASVKPASPDNPPGPVDVLVIDRVERPTPD